MGDTWQIVDSIASSPTVLLDLNDLDTVGSGFRVDRASTPPPRLRRAVSQNAMRDGVFVSSSNYDDRIVALDLQVIASSQDNLATEWQTLARLLDRQETILKYQPASASKPVFFKASRSDYPSLEDVLSATPFRRPSAELYCEPFAYGLAETFSPSWTMNGASGGMEYTCPTILGDVAAPLNIDLTTNIPTAFKLSSLAYPTARTYPTIVRAGTNGDFTLGTDASGTTGAGTGFWNGDYIGVSFATTATDAVRATATAVALLQPGDYRVFGKFEITAGTADVYLNRMVQTSIIPGYSAIQTGPTVEIGGGTVYLGDFRVPFFDTTGDASSMPATTRWDVMAARTSGAGTLRFDGLIFVATTTDHGPLVRLLDVDAKNLPAWFGSPVLRIDSVYERLIRLNSTSFAEIQLPEEYVGGFPMVLPGHNNRLRLIPSTPFATSTTTSGTATYYPQYLHVRPSAS